MRYVKFRDIQDRSERVRVARALRAEGMKLREIAATVEAPISTVHEHIVDPTLSRHRERRYARGAVCVDCGIPVDYSYSRPSLRCAKCAVPVFTARTREASAAYRALIEGMWAEGMTGSQISASVGRKINVSSLRSRGYNLPYRRTPEQVARITAGATERLVLARAVKKMGA